MGHRLQDGEKVQTLYNKKKKKIMTLHSADWLL